MNLNPQNKTYFIQKVLEVHSFEESSTDDKPLPEVEEGNGRNLFTFSSETASLIKFLTVANIPFGDDSQLICDNCRISSEQESNPRKIPKRDQSLFTSDIHCHSADSNDSPDIDKNASCSYSVDISDNNSTFCAIQENDEEEPNHSCSCRTSDKSRNLNMNISADFCRQCHVQNLSRNLIFVTGEFAVALHQIGFKNVSPCVLDLPLSPSGYNDESIQAGETHMVVSFSNNDVQLRPVRTSDKPDNLLDLYGQVTGLCLSHDSRYIQL